MKDYLLVFRADFSLMPNRTPEEMQAMSKRWMDWIGSIAAQNKLAGVGNRLEGTGRVLKGDSTITNGPYAEIKESIGGYSIVKADSYEAAIELAKGCPILKQGGNVEVREISEN
ncbi:YciI family protein [Niastella populi]|uniref:Transcription initiation protein n=1 Tax=Niastella populi TaxID=550983 RepID=A0A1V9G264_9BACT|nr:YciI family protein [Niastella populi]OQP64588.1 transcription initiation protein [Niastella populi]